jgi:hypothetical protein
MRHLASALTSLLLFACAPRAQHEAPRNDDATSLRLDGLVHPTSDGDSLDAEAGDAEPLLADADSPSDAAAPPIHDLDRDGLDDDYEASVARAYLPYRSVHPQDGCALGAILYRLRPHPDAPTTRLHMIVDSIFQSDCGAGGHSGDDEVFGMTIDPSLPAPDGILAIRAISHQDTFCQAITDCGPCNQPQLAACAHAMRDGKPFPVVFYSKGKHGSYVDESTCNGACFFTNWCTLSDAPSEPPMLNVGEPDAPLVRDLTAAGIITSTAGWTDQSLFGFDPWGPSKFGNGGGVLSLDFVDDAFTTPACAR